MGFRPVPGRGIMAIPYQESLIYQLWLLFRRIIDAFYIICRDDTLVSRLKRSTPLYGVLLNTLEK